MMISLTRQAHNSGNRAGWAGGKTLKPITQLIVIGFSIFQLNSTDCNEDDEDDAGNCDGGGCGHPESGSIPI